MIDGETSSVPTSPPPALSSLWMQLVFVKGRKQCLYFNFRGSVRSAAEAFSVRWLLRLNKWSISKVKPSRRWGENLFGAFYDSLTAEVSPWLHPAGCATSEAKNAGKRSRDLGKSAGLIVLLWFWSVLGCFCKVIRKRSSCSSSEWRGHTSFQEIVCIHWLMQFY